MKRVTIILSIFILSLSIIPCADNLTHNNVITDRIKSSTDHNHNSAERDHCTPFCACFCCGTTVFITLLPTLENEPLINTEKLSYYFNYQYAFIFLNNIWQPPKMIG